MVDTRKWKCLLGLHHYSETINSGEYQVRGVCYVEKSGTFYSKRCAHCGKLKNFYLASKLPV